MNRKSFLKNLGLLTAGSVAAPSFIKLLTAEGPFFKIRDDLGYFSGRGGTIGWFVTDDAIVVVDAQFPNTAEEFVRGIADYGSGPSRVLFNTHHHGDHTAGNPVFAENSYQIIAHENVPVLQRRAAEAQGDAGAFTAADITFTDDYTLEIGNERIVARHYGNAHTGGDSVIWFENRNAAHMGDLVFNRWYPFIDRPGGASILGWIDLLETVASEADSDTVFIFGHANADFGVTGDTGDLLYMRDFLSKLLEHTQAGIDAGQSREEITNVNRFEEFPDHQSAGARLSLPANLNVAYDELTSE
jgi:cyclase